MSDKHNREEKKYSSSEEEDLFQTIFKEATLEIRREKAEKNKSPEAFSMKPPGRWQKQRSLLGTETKILKPSADVPRKPEKGKAPVQEKPVRAQKDPQTSAKKTGSRALVKRVPAAAILFSLSIILAGAMAYDLLGTLDVWFLLDYLKTGDKGEVAQVSAPEKQSTGTPEKVTVPSSQPKATNQSSATAQEDPKSPLPAQAESSFSTRMKENRVPEIEKPTSIEQAGSGKERIGGGEPSAIATDQPKAPEVATKQESQAAHAKTEFSSEPDASKISSTQLSAPKYPYSVYLGSFKSTYAVQKAMSEFHEKGLSPYCARVDLGEKGVWFRFFAGHFRSKEEAEKFVRERRIQGAEPAETKYANIIGVYESDQEVENRRGVLVTAGFYPYVIRSSDGKRLLYSGAFDRKEYAEKERVLLTSKGIKTETVER